MRVRAASNSMDSKRNYTAKRTQQGPIDMSTETTVRETAVISEEARPETDAPTADVRTKAELLGEAIASVRADSRRQAELYLSECQVPHGGE